MDRAIVATEILALVLCIKLATVIWVVSNRPLSGVEGDILHRFWLSPFGRRVANDFAQPA